MDVSPTRLVIGFSLAYLTATAAVVGAANTLDTGKIEQLTGAKGTLNEKAGVFKISAPRNDLTVTVAGVKMTPPMGLTSWAAFQKVNGHTMVMGDMTLLEDQVNPVMSVALDNGLAITALHNHFFWDSPKVMFMHIEGMGDTEAVATAVGKVLAKIQETSGGKGDTPHVDLDPLRTSLDPNKIDTVIGTKGNLANGVYKATMGRSAQMNGHQIGSDMGVNTWAAFVGSDDTAAVDGDFVMTEQELQPVLKALRAAGAIHNHMTNETPRMMFLHYWGVGSTTQLARGLKAALDTQHR